MTHRRYVKLIPTFLPEFWGRNEAEGYYGFHLYRLLPILSRNKCLKVDFSKWQIIHNKDSGKQGHTYNRLLFTVSPPIVGRCQRWRVWGWLSFSLGALLLEGVNETLTRLWYNQQMASTLFHAFSSPHAISPHLWSFSCADHVSSLMGYMGQNPPTTLGYLPESGQSELLLLAVLYIWPADNASCSVGFNEVGWRHFWVYSCIRQNKDNQVNFKLAKDVGIWWFCL